MLNRTPQNQVLTVLTISLGLAIALITMLDGWRATVPVG